MPGLCLIITASMITLASVCNYSIVLFLLGTVSLILCFFVAIVLSFGGHLTIHLASFCFTISPAISTTLILSLSHTCNNEHPSSCCCLCWGHCGIYLWQLECYTFLSGFFHPSLCSWKCRFKNRDPHGVLGCNHLCAVVHKNSFFAVHPSGLGCS